MEVSNTSKTTLLSHIYNEEYLLPFWLQHHKDMFDEIIIIDYNSTDRSVEICKTICPDCKIITSRNENFDATLVDKEVMDIENTIEGIKIVLNTTEFLFCDKPLKDLFIDYEHYAISLSINMISPYSNSWFEVNDCNELFTNLFDSSIRFHYDRSTRFIHNFRNGNYTIGRHSTNHIFISTDDAHIV